MDISLDGITVSGLACVVAPNPSPMTAQGTNTYLIGRDEVTVIDPGPDDPQHLAAVMAIVDNRRVSRIVITHSHLDHSGLAPALSRATGAPILAFGDSFAGQSAVMRRLVQMGRTGGGEGVDAVFRPDQTVADRDQIETDLGPLRVIHTPGHMGNHICLALRGMIFSGDHVLNWSTSLISPPDGDLTDYMRSLTRLQSERASILLPGHGGVVADPASRLDALITHRWEREAQITRALADGPAGIAALTTRVYFDTPPTLHPAAARNVFAHLIDMEGRNIVAAAPDLQFDARFTLI